MVDKLPIFKVDNEGTMEVLVSDGDKEAFSPNRLLNSSLLIMPPEPLSIDIVTEVDKTDVGSYDEFRLNVCEIIS